MKIENKQINRACAAFDENLSTRITEQDIRYFNHIETEENCGFQFSNDGT